MILHRFRRAVTAGLLCLLVVVGCAAIAASAAETPGERFEKAMKRLAEQCAKLKLPPNRTDCDPLQLKPADPLATPEGRFAHSIKIPNPVPEDSGYKPGMTPQEYFEHLCKTEAGEFIYKTVENVEGLYMMRPRERATDYMLQDLYAMEDPYGHQDWEVRAPEKYFVRPSSYSFFENPLAHSVSTKPEETKYRRYSGKKKDVPRDMITDMVSEQVGSLQSRYSYIWRGVKRPHDRDLGIAGGELIVFDLQTNEVLAMRRGFIRSGDVRNSPTGIWWLGGHVCPKDGARLLYTYEFISRVLKPIGLQNQEKEKDHAAK